MKGAYFFKYSRELRYLLFFVTAFLVIATVKVYVNNINIDNSILDNIKQQVYYKDKEAFEKNFYLKYLSGDDALMFFSHENNITLSGENIIKFTDLEKVTASPTVSGDENVSYITGGYNKIAGNIVDQIIDDERIINITLPQDSWKYFLGKKFQALNQVLVSQ